MSKKRAGNLRVTFCAPPYPCDRPTSRPTSACLSSVRSVASQAVNSALVLLYWHIGERIRCEVLKGGRAEYGKEVLATLSQALTVDYGRGYTVDNLTRMVKLAEVFPDRGIVGALSQELGWSHFVLLLPIKEPLRREFYAEMCRVERWSVRTLRKKIHVMLYERTAISQKPAELAKRELAELRSSDMLSPDLVFRDPYLLDFCGLRDTYSESDLEAAILREIESFLLELGAGFTFIARQKAHGDRRRGFLPRLAILPS